MLHGVALTVPAQCGRGSGQQQAVQMSDIILSKQGIDPRVVDLANQIKAAQGSEIQQMQGWLTQWDSQCRPAGA